MKKSVLLLFAIFMAMTSFAQLKNVQANSITPADGETWWGYFADADANASNFGGYGVGTQADYEAAIKIAKSDPVMGNATIKAVRIWLNGTTIPKITSLKIWTTKTLKINAQGVLYAQDVDLSTLTAGANDIEFTTPFAINNAVTYIGFTMTLDGQDNAVMCGGEYEAGTFFFRATAVQTNWQSLTGHGKLALQVLAEGAVVPQNCAIMTSTNLGTHNYQVGDEAIVPVTIKNKGQNPISSISYTITTNNDPATATPEVTVAMDNVPFNGTATFNASFDTSEALNSTRTVTITKVNGEPNEAQANQCVASGNFAVMAYLFTKVPVIEEFTGTWCGWCPRGFVAMETANELYGDKVVLIAAHNGDPMEIAGYNPVMATVSGFPDAKANRNQEFDPNPPAIQSIINQSLNEVPIGKVDIVAQWNDEAMTKIDVKSNSMFAFAEENANYGIALVLTEDGMHGTGSSWGQSNYYSGQSGYPDYMSWWCSQGSRVSGLSYNFVAVAAWDILSGANGSVPTSFAAGEALPYNFLADISSNTIIQDKSKLKIAALLIDRAANKIINAAQTTISDYSSVVPGDVDGDGEVTAGDVTKLYNILLNDDETGVVNGDQDGDGVITAADITAIYNILLGQ